VLKIKIYSVACWNQEPTIAEWRTVDETRYSSAPNGTNANVGGSPSILIYHIRELLLIFSNKDGTEEQ